VNKRWIVLTETHLEFKDEKKVCLKKYGLIWISVERLPSQSLQLTTLKVLNCLFCFVLFLFVCLLVCLFIIIVFF
jgi:hypothetical protein